jgi:HNH endonuclease
MFDTKDKAGFLGYFGELPIKKSTLTRHYGVWVNRLDKEITENITALRDLSDKAIARIAELLPPRFNKDHKDDARCTLRHYRRYREKCHIRKIQRGIRPARTEKEVRERVLRSIALRRGQAAFRDVLMTAFDSQCVMTGTDDVDTLEAAHIRPYTIGGASDVANGLLLRADIHVLFDLYLISLKPQTLAVFCHKSIRCSKTYGSFHGKRAHIPLGHQINARALAEHYGMTAS